MKNRFALIAIPASFILSFFVVFFWTYSETIKLSSVIKPLVRTSVNNGVNGNIPLSIENLAEENGQISDFAVYNISSKAPITGEQSLIRELDDATVPFFTKLRVKYDLTFLKNLTFDKQDIGIVIKFDSGYFLFWQLILSVIIFFVLYGIKARTDSFKRDEKEKALREKMKFLNEISHEICNGNNYEEIRLKNAKAIFLLEGHKIDTRAVTLTNYLHDIMKEFCSDHRFITQLNHPSDLTILDQPLGLVFTNLLTNCVKHNDYGQAEIHTWTEDGNFYCKIRNNVNEKCSKEHISRFYGNNERTGLGLVRRSLKLIGCGDDSLRPVFGQKYTDIFLKLPLDKVALDQKPAVLTFKPTVAIIDDQKSHRNRLLRNLGSETFNCVEYSHVEHFYDDLDAGKRFHVVIVDRNGDQLEDPTMSKWDAVENCFSDCARRLGHSGKIILYSNASVGASDFDEVLAKTGNHDWESIISGLLQSK